MQGCTHSGSIQRRHPLGPHATLNIQACSDVGCNGCAKLACRRLPGAAAAPHGAPPGRLCERCSAARSGASLGAWGQPQAAVKLVLQLALQTRPGLPKGRCGLLLSQDGAARPPRCMSAVKLRSVRGRSGLCWMAASQPPPAQALRTLWLLLQRRPRRSSCKGQPAQPHDTRLVQKALMTSTTPTGKHQFHRVPKGPVMRVRSITCLLITRLAPSSRVAAGIANKTRAAAGHLYASAPSMTDYTLSGHSTGLRTPGDHP